jgi:small-conductance mechanosensitive channel
LLVQLTVLLTAATASALLVAWLSATAVRRVATTRRRARFLRQLDQTCRRPWAALLLAVSNLTALSWIHGDGGVELARNALRIAVVAAAAWLVVRMLLVAEDLAFRRLRIDVPNNRRVRRARTQVSLLRRLTAVVITVLVLATIFTTFTPLRTLGASLFASAGVAGVVVGLAAQATLNNVLAGVQLAWTDTLRFDDIVVVEGQWGRIEELTLTFVVVHLWDERRLVLPTTYFTKTPFENWSRQETRVLGSVELHLDFRAPVAALRAETRRLVEASPLWDRREWVLQVIDTTPATMVVRVLASSADAPSSWDLRCELREALIAFLTNRYPDAFPRIRTVTNRPR